MERNIREAAEILGATIECVTPKGAHPHAPKQCRSCGAPIYWAQTDNLNPVTGKRRAMPVDAEPHPEGSIQLVDRHGSVLAFVIRPDARDGKKLRRPHFQTCPDAASWRTQG
jgi:hypothetical protein